MLKRIGIPGDVWATHYANGWTVYTWLNGPVAFGLTENEAKVMINSILPKED